MAAFRPAGPASRFPRWNRARRLRLHRGRRMAALRPAGPASRFPRWSRAQSADFSAVGAVAREHYVERRAGLELGPAGHERGVAEDRDRWAIWAIPIAIVVCGVAIRFTDRLWLVDLFDGPGLSQSGNFTLGLAVAAGWYVFPLIVFLVRKVSGGRSVRATTPATVVLSIFAALS